MSERDSLQVAYCHVLADLRGKLAGVDAAIGALEAMRREKFVHTNKAAGTVSPRTGADATCGATCPR